MSRAPEHLDELALVEARNELRSAGSRGQTALSVWAVKWGDALIDRALEAVDQDGSDWEGDE